MSFHVPELQRVVTGPAASDASYGNEGAFRIKSPYRKGELFIIASEEGGWDHVSARFVKPNGKSAIPNWDEMCHLKDVFWDEEDCVVQYHPPRSMYVSLHPHVLHLWRCTERPDWVEMPPTWMLGPLDSEGVKGAIG